MAQQIVFPSLRAQPGEIALNALAAGQHHEVRRGQRLAGSDVAKIDLRMCAQRIEIGVVADARQRGHDHTQHGSARRGGVTRGRQHVFGIEPQARHERHNAEDGLAGTCFDPIDAGFEQRRITAEFVDDHTFDARPFRFRKTRERADDLREDAASIDIGNENHGAIGRFGESHVRNIALAQIDFGWAARAFHEHEIVLCPQSFKRFEHGLHRDGLVRMIGARIEVAARLPMHDHLRADVAVRLEQHRIHIRMRFDARSQRLPRLGAADFAAVDGDGAVERHILRLERCDAQAGARGDSAKRAYQCAFAGIGARSLNHQCAWHGYGPEQVGDVARAARKHHAIGGCGEAGLHYVTGAGAYARARCPQGSSAAIAGSAVARQ